MHDGDATPPQLVEDPKISDALRRASRDITTVDKFTAGTTISALSSNTAFTGIDVYEDSIFKTDAGYSAPATIYVELNFDDSKEKTVVGASYPGRVIFKMNDDQANFIDISADISGA
jgi:hypothetical protein